MAHTTFFNTDFTFLSLTCTLRKYALVFVVLALLNTSCEDVVVIQLDEYPPVLSVDAWVTDGEELQTIILSQTANYFDSSTTPKIDNAVVAITRQDGVQFAFEYDQKGRYIYDPSFNGKLGTIGDVFNLSISYDDSNYCASTTMHRVPQIDSIGLEYKNDDIFYKDGIYAQFYARDFAGIGDSYWIKTFKNGVFRNNPRELNIAFDAAFDAGSGVDGLVFISPIRELINPVNADFEPVPWQPDESIKVEIHSISTSAFHFMEIARDQMTNGDNAIFALPLANTRGNISECTSGEEVLGFFNVAAVSSSSRVIE